MPEPQEEVKKKDSGPLVVKFESPSQASLRDQNMSNIARPTPPRGRKLIIFVGCLIGIATYRSFVENFDDIPEASSILRKSETSDKRGISGFSLFDINGPPPTNERITEETGGLLSFGKALRQIDNSGKVSKKAAKPNLESKPGKKNGSPTFSFMDSVNDDDEVPRAAAGAVQTAAEALLCPNSVVDYVINATDLKDECDGLRKVFSKYCADADAPSMQGDDRRRLMESEKERIETNPVMAWQFWLRHIVQSLHQWWNPGDYYENLPMTQRFESLKFPDILFDQSHRRLAERETVKKQAQLEDDAGDADDEKAGRSQTKASLKEKTKRTLDLPIKGHRLSQKALSESLYLQQDDKAVIASLQAAQNNTNSSENGAISDAAASLKAVSDATKYVSSVLNDPTSVEARTCCTSVLSVFHEICSIDEEESLSDKQLFIVVAVIVVCGLVKSLIRHFQVRWLPEAAGCILVGGKLLVGPSRLMSSHKCRSNTFSQLSLSFIRLGDILYPASRP